MRLGAGLATGVVAFVLALALGPGPSEATGVVDGPVVAVSMTGGAYYPDALVQGNLNLRGDCLMLGNAVVFWLAGTSWDARSRSVVFSGDFAGAASVGSHFVGGGGVFTATDDFLRGLGAAGEVLRDCATATGAQHLTLTYP